MVYIVAGLLLLWLSSNLLREFVRANPALLARRLKQSGGIAVLLFALLLLVRGQLDGAFVLAGLGFWLTSGRRVPNWRDALASTWRRPARRQSSVRSPWIEMSLNHASGVMEGRVLGGPYAGRPLENLDAQACLNLYRLCLSGDPEGARLLEAYLDRRFAGWREAEQGEGHARRADDAGGRRQAGRGMSEDEAYKLLGLAQGASREEITRAHRALMKRFHPDHGGSTDLAARVNEAKDVLMRRHP